MTVVSVWLLFGLVFAAGIIALQARDLVVAAIVLSAFSFLIALLYGALGALDVGFNEAVLGAGVTGLLFMATIFRTSRRSSD
jgi:multicomponent Na+:H+ antiporter subunit B